MGFRVFLGAGFKTVGLGLIVGLSQAPHWGRGSGGGRGAGEGGGAEGGGGAVEWASTASGPGEPSACGPRFPGGVPI